MSVEATHFNPFPPQFIPERELVAQVNSTYAYNAQQTRFYGIPFAAALPENHLSYQPAVCESFQAKTSINTDSGLTYNISAPKKRSRESCNQLHAAQNFGVPNKCNAFSQLPSIAGDDIIPQIQQYEFEMDDIISQHTKKIKFELEKRQKYQARLLTAAIGEDLMKKLKEKDEQIQRIEKLNLVFQERAKSLYIENQLWRDLAQKNEDTANSLRSHLEQVLHNADTEEKVQSCCGSTNGVGDDIEDGNSIFSGERRCRICRETESSVLFLPCRHLCLCNVCWSSYQQLESCPVCKVTMTATLHVNMA